jgi:hypothetical protein
VNGLSAEVMLTGSIPEAEQRLLRSLLGEGQFAGGDRFAAAGAVNYLYSSHVFPVREIPQVSLFAEQLESAFQKTTKSGGTAIVCFPSESSDELFEVYRRFRENPTQGFGDRVALLSETASALAPNGEAGKLLDIWDHIRRALDSVMPLDRGGPVLLLGTVAQRWLTRPLVPFPMELSPEEKAYYRSFQFQARSEAHAADLMDCQASKMISGPTGTWLAGKMIIRALHHLEKADVLTDQLRSADTGMSRLQFRLRVLKCLLRNVMHTSQYQDLLERASNGFAEREVDRGGTARVLGVNLQGLVRAESDNIEELITLLEASESNPLLTAEREEGETIFELAPLPALVAQLRLKVALMRKRYNDHLRLISE